MLKVTRLFTFLLDRALILAATLACFSLATSAQTVQSYTDASTPELVKAGAPEGSYALSGIDTVSMYGGGMSMRIPVRGIGGRGLVGYTMSVPIYQRWRTEWYLDSGITAVNVIDQNNHWLNEVPYYSPGALTARWVGNPQAPTTCPNPGHPDWELFSGVLPRITYQSADGTETDLYAQSNDGAPKVPTCANNYAVDFGDTFVASDGSGIKLVLDTALILDGRIPSSGGSSGEFDVFGTVYFRDGSTYRLGTSDATTYLTDRNGNQTTFTFVNVQDVGTGIGHLRIGRGVGTVTDSLGREVTISYGTPSNPCDQVQFLGYAGASRAVKVCYTNLQSRFDAGYTAQTYSQLFPKLNVALVGSSLYDQLVVSNIELPDSTKYEFFYNSFGEVVRTMLPTGGRIEYVYGPGNDTGVSTNGPGGEFGLTFSTYLAGQTGIYRRVKERRVYADGSTLEGKTVFSTTVSTDASACPGSFSNKTLIVTADHRDASSVTVSKDRHYFCGDPGDINSLAYFALTDPYSLPRWQEALEYRTDEMDATASILRQMDTTYQQRASVAWFSGSQSAAPPRDPRKTRVDTALKDVSPNLVSRADYQYDAYTNRTEESIYDFGSGAPGALLREVSTNYLHATDSSYVTGPIYLPSLPTQERVHLGATDYARTTYEYDVYTGGSCASVAPNCHAALQSRSGIIQMISAYASGTETHRGNVTATQQWRDIGPADVFTYQKYDVAGNVVQTIDGNGNSTSIAYATGASTYAFPSEVTNALSQVTGLLYDSNIGRITSVSDVNQKLTSLSYSDPLDRLKQVTDPLGTTTYSYVPQAGNSYVTASKSLELVGPVETITYFDGLGREKQTVQNEGASSIATGKHYDALGRLSQVSNPSRSTPTEWTETRFDALSRPVSVTAPDQSVAYTAYSGNKTITKDPANKWRQVSLDSLGRIKSVTEDPTVSAQMGGTTHSNTSTASPQLETSYSYDPQGDLLTVTQGGRNRTFTYDSLGRLKSASNPEAATINYVYDGVGNLTSRYDSRVSTTLGYDALSRVVSKSYTSTPSTPSVTYCYDGNTSGACSGAPASNPPNALNLVGRLTRVSTSDGNSTSFSSYDALGRVLTSSQSVVGGANPYLFTYTYNHVGLKSVQYPSGTTITYTFDAAGRTKQADWGTNKSVAVNGANGFTPHGAIADLVLGSGGSQLRQAISFNSRLQPTQIAVTPASAGTPNLLNLGYAYCTAGCTDNNGNVRQQTISYAALGGDPSFSVSQTYTYDSLNRLGTFAEIQTIQSPPPSIGETFTHDRWGNMAVTATTGLTASPLTPTALSWFSTSDNRLNGVGYDASGNQTQYNPFTATYDAENRVQGVTSTSNGSASYVYDGQGRRVKKTAGATVIYYVYDAFGDLAAEYSNQASSDTGTQYLLTDSLGSVRAVADATGTVVKRYDYRPFGQEIPSTVNGRSSKYLAPVYPGAGDGQSLKFTGKERDAETGLDYFGARYMSSAQGRFTSPDEFTGGIVDAYSGGQVMPPGPLPYADIGDPQTLNKYIYVRNNPLRYVDPDGHDWEDVAYGVVEFSAGIGRGIAASESWGAVGAPSSSDSVSSRAGQAVGTLVAAVVGTTASAGGAAITVGSAGTATVVGGAVAIKGAATAIGAVKNIGALLNAPIESRRAGDFSSSTREGKIKQNADANSGVNKCEKCGQDLVRAKAEKGQTPPKNQLQVHHDPPISQGGGKNSTPKVLCRDCHEGIHNP